MDKSTNLYIISFGVAICFISAVVFYFYYTNQLKDYADIYSKNIIIIFVAIMGFLGITVYSYFKYINPTFYPKYVDNKEYVEKDNVQLSDSSQEYPIATIILFHASWCPYSKKLRDEGTYETFKTLNDGKIINNYKLSIIDIDASNDQDPEISKQLDEYSVEGFPSIKLLKESDNPSKAYDFDAKPTLDSLNQFVQEVL